MKKTDSVENPGKQARYIYVALTQLGGNFQTKNLVKNSIQELTCSFLFQNKDKFIDIYTSHFKNQNLILFLFSEGT